jgi:CheY-like chemotaxis protein
VLVVDDEATVRSAVARMLEELGYEVVQAADGQSALDRLGSAPAVDLVLLDLIMPRMSGTQVLRELRRTQPGLPVVVTTGHAAGEDPMALGATALLRKPYTMSELAQTVSTLLAG